VYIARVPRDSNDDPIIATTCAGDVEYIVTFDHDRLVIKQHKDIQIVEPGEFQEILLRTE
jgi:predicted nucleic acid-binding protein